MAQIATPAVQSGGGTRRCRQFPLSDTCRPPPPQRTSQAHGVWDGQTQLSHGSLPQAILTRGGAQDLRPRGNPCPTQKAGYQEQLPSCLRRLDLGTTQSNRLLPPASRLRHPALTPRAQLLRPNRRQPAQPHLPPKTRITDDCDGHEKAHHWTKPSEMAAPRFLST